MMEKHFTSQSVQKLGSPEPEAPRETFPVGTKFELNGLTYYVIKAWIDTSTDWRHLSGPNGADQQVQLHTLIKDSQSKGFRWLDATPVEKLFMKGVQQ